MHYRGVQEADLVLFVNKVLQNMKSSFSVDSISKVFDNDLIEFSGKRGKITASISDFGMADIGFKSLVIDTGEKTLEFKSEDRPAMAARILPSIEGFKQHIAESKGVEYTDKVLNAIQTYGIVKLVDKPLVLLDGKGISLSDFEVKRDRVQTSQLQVGYGG